MITLLNPAKLRWQLSDTALLRRALNQRPLRKHGRIGAMAQERAITALELGLGIKQRGYNIFVVGDDGTGRTSTVRQMLKDRAAKEPVPDDTVLLYNFAERDRPLAVGVPPSSGPKLKKTYETLVERMIASLESAFDSDYYLSGRQEIQENCRRKTDEVLGAIEKEAHTQGFVLSRAAGALTLTPAGKSGKAITEEEFDLLEEEIKQDMEKKAEKLEGRLEDALRKVRSIEKDGEDAIETLERKTADSVIKPLFENARVSWKHSRHVLAHLDAMREDVLSRLRRLVPDEGPVSENGEGSSNLQASRKSHDEEDEFGYEEPAFLRYRVNVLVSHSKSGGAPVVEETHPTSSNLIGRIEQKVRAGETITDFTHIRAGALYRANGGYLLLDAQDLLREPSAWEGLKRALKNRAVELDDPGEPGRMVAVAAIRPEPVPLSLKVILIGTPELYYALSKNDPDFIKLFKVKADFDIEMPRSDEKIVKFLQFLNGLCHEEKLRKLAPSGAARLIEHAVRLSGNQNKITTRLGAIADLAREASFWASKLRSRKIEESHVRRALAAKAEREGFIEAHMMNDILMGKVIIETEGEVVGQANALTVLELGSYEFGMPLRVTCRVGTGKGEIVDIEREVELGGPIHTKGTMILRGLLADRFGQNISLGLSATVCMEQTYNDVDGDSASLAEACALFSMLAKAPIDQKLAMTGAIDQRGQVQAVGGINEKIEGFYNLCMKRGGNSVHGVIIPQSNVDDIMLKEELVASCAAGTFVIYAIDTFEDALALLTKRDWNSGEKPLKADIIRTLEHLHTLRTEGPRYENRRWRNSPEFWNNNDFTDDFIKNRDQPATQKREHLFDELHLPAKS